MSPSVLLDAYAMIAVLQGEPAAEKIRPVIDAHEAWLHPLNLAEVLDRMSRLAGADPDDVEADVVLLGISVLEADSSLLVDAGRLRARHYDRATCAVSLADCVAAVYAVRHGMTLATSDLPLAAVVRAEGGDLAPLPDSSGVYP